MTPRVLREGGPRGPLGQTIYSKVLWSALGGAWPFKGRFRQLWASSGQRLSAHFRPDLASSGPLPALFRAALGLSGLLVAALASICSLAQVLGLIDAARFAQKHEIHTSLRLF